MSLERYENFRGGFNRLRMCKILKQPIASGYNIVFLYKNGCGKMYLVHRLVACAFIDNPHNLPVVNHINEIKTDNRASNLEWTTQKENLEYSGNTAKATNKRKKPIMQLNKNGDFIAEFESSYEAERKTGIAQSHISNCCNGRGKSAGRI